MTNVQRSITGAYGRRSRVSSPSWHVNTATMSAETHTITHRLSQMMLQKYSKMQHILLMDPGGYRPRLTFLESFRRADVKPWLICNSATYSFRNIRGCKNRRLRSQKWSIRVPFLTCIWRYRHQKERTHHHHVLYFMLAESSKTICSNCKTTEDKKRKKDKLRFKKQIDASIN